ncbi:MAG: maltose alpha-D-glucosyltransferase, partial [Chthoniobacterales bacterium]
MTNKDSDGLWYKRAVIYELHVRSFYDANGDGIGDFQGLKSKLGYLKDLGVTALWLLPFYPSPLRDDGYDIADYFSVHPNYGTLDDFKEFLAAAHALGLRVITELVINHTSNQHAWFQRARESPPGSPDRDLYVWSDTPHRFEDARIIFKDFETSNWAWDPVAKAYYWHRFYSHQPDLNFDSPRLRDAIFEVIDFWLELGVDGMRLDAVPYLYEREGTTCENLPETHAFLRELRRHVDEKFSGRMLLAEANQWPEDAASYFGKGDECQMAFHFPLMPRLFMAVQMEDRFPIIDILEQTPPIAENCQWAIFLRNHDELTLEMVTDEERDYMYQIYAQDPRARINLGIRRRLAPLLGNNRKKIELINALLLSLPGTPIIYYGDEIGMGDNFYLGDRNGVRTPMQWSADRNAGFSQCNPQQLFLPVIIDPEFHYEAINADTQQKNLSSLYWWMRRMLTIQQGHPVFSEGTIEFLSSDNAKILTFLRQSKDETVLVIANLSRFAQAVRLDLSRYKGRVPEELFGGNAFPEITETPGIYTIGPYGFYWLTLAPPSAESALQNAYEPPSLLGESVWSESLKSQLEVSILPRYLRSCRWFGDKHRNFRAVRIVSDFTRPQGNDAVRIVLLEVSFMEGLSAIQILPLAICEEKKADAEIVKAKIAQFSDGHFLYDALYVPEFRKDLFDIVSNGTEWRDASASIQGYDLPGAESKGTPTQSKLQDGEQSNTSLIYDKKWMLKLFRRFEPGPEPEADILRALATKNFAHVPRYEGEIRCRLKDSEGSIGVLTSYVENQGDGWTYTLDALERFFERILTLPEEQTKTVEELEVIGNVYPERVRQLGVRTGELHQCLQSLPGTEFTPEAFTIFYQRSTYQSMRSLVRRTELELKRKLPELSPKAQESARVWMEKSPDFIKAYSRLLNRKINATRIRVHGDYHLGQVLNTGNDFTIIDFGGEPRRTLGERLLKRSPL